MDLGLLGGGGTDISIVSPQSRDFGGAAGKEVNNERGGIRLGRGTRESNGETEEGA